MAKQEIHLSCCGTNDSVPPDDARSASNGETMSEQDYERYPSLTVDDVESCYRVLEIVREDYDERGERKQEQQLTTAHNLIETFECRMRRENDELRQ